MLHASPPSDWASPEGRATLKAIFAECDAAAREAEAARLARLGDGPRFRDIDYAAEAFVREQHRLGVRSHVDRLLDRDRDARRAMLVQKLDPLLSTASGAARLEALLDSLLAPLAERRRGRV